MSETNNPVLERMESVLKFASENVLQKQEWATKVKENWEKTLQNEEAIVKASMSS
ncbi:hypothetical protein [Acetobacter tropicalis]|uniref:hypothetical protein n=1 Tax=Acetobacter tropicalis TaxID=104102 RepID=UPI000A74411D|nr:hypothetical protein [Acetobacter tropicalis]